MTNDNNRSNQYRTGKTTNTLTSAQIARLCSGSTFYVDPKGDDPEDFLDKIPQERLDEVIFEEEDTEE